jgi:hypothetical protein
LGHFARDYWFRKKNPREGKHHASTSKDDESKRKQKSPSNEKETRNEYYLVFCLCSKIITGLKTWLVGSGASKHMTGYKEILLDFKTKSDANPHLCRVCLTSWTLDLQIPKPKWFVGPC